VVCRLEVHLDGLRTGVEACRIELFRSPMISPLKPTAYLLGEECGRTERATSPASPTAS
jgi:hypothetical protein